MFAKNTSVMLYVDDLAAECTFWRAIGFQIITDECDGPVPYFAMKTAPEATLTLIVYDRDFIKKSWIINQAFSLKSPICKPFTNGLRKLVTWFRQLTTSRSQTLLFNLRPGTSMR